ncbi:MAG: T9SS type A sorting domain-containing protein, partial [Bacteroidia bacterium]
FEPRSGFQIHYQPLVANSSLNTRTYFPFSIPLIGTDSFEMDAVYSIWANSSVIKSNDTIKRRYLFYNQYAYDDGTAEYGYGLNTNGGRIAYRFISTRADSLRGVSLSFIPIKTDVSRELFTLMVWKSIPEPGTGKGEQLIYQSNFQKPKYQRFYNGFVNYEFDSAIAISDTFYIGWQQNTDKVLSLGLDRNDTANSNMFYNVTGTWQSSGIPGAWMMRPILGKRTNLKIPTLELQRESISVYPNPAQEQLFISGLNTLESPSFEIYSSMGQKMQSGFIFDGQIQLDPSLHGLMFLNINVHGERICFKFLKD